MGHHTEQPPFLRLPKALRQRIYRYLLLKHTNEIVTTINYDLSWPFLEHPSSTTFTSHQLDLCRCPQQQARSSIIATEDHIYTRYICHGPEVRFRPRSEKLWILHQPGPAFNILRPESPEEHDRRPRAGIIRVSKRVYRETIPILYGDRDFLFLSGVCSRGRYQAYATQAWLNRLGSLARSHVTALSLICQTNEEDCRIVDARQAYTDLAYDILLRLPNFQKLSLYVRTEGAPILPFSNVLRRDGVELCVGINVGEGDVDVFSNAQQFLNEWGDQESEDTKWEDVQSGDEDEEWDLVSPGSPGSPSTRIHASR